MTFFRAVSRPAALYLMMSLDLIMISLTKVEPILAAAIKDSARIYLFGSSFGSGIHDIHMNQGSLPQYPNGVYQDGAILVEFQNGHWEAIFLAFASQKTQTDDDSGKPLSGSDSFAEILGAR